MRIILDENLPKYLKTILQRYTVKTVQEEGWAGIKNGELMEQINNKFDVLITADKNLKYQQNLRSRKIAIIQLYTNRLPLIKKLEARIIKTLNEIEPRQYIEISP